MIEDGIFDGDYIFVRKQSTAETGEVVVVMIEGEATCKRFYPEGDRVRLQPANESMNPIYVSTGTSSARSTSWARWSASIGACTERFSLGAARADATSDGRGGGRPTFSLTFSVGVCST